MKDPLLEVSQIAAMAALAQCGAFDAILRGPTTAADLAAKLSLHEGALRRALEVARAYGFLCERDDVYAVRAEHATFADKVLALARSFPEHLRSGAGFTRDQNDRGRLYAVATPLLGTWFRPSAEKLAAALVDAPCQSVLDVGAGSGVWSLAMAARHPGTVVSALDLPPVLERFREHVGSAAHELIAGDYHEVDLEPRWDRVVLANVLHLETPERARALLQRASQWRRPGGLLVVVDALLRNEASDLALATYELHLALRVDGGRVYEDHEIRAWARDAGLAVHSTITLDASTGWGALVLQ